MTSGAAAVLLQVNPTLTPDQIAATLKATGVPIQDPRNGLTFPRVNLQTAVQWIGPDQNVRTQVDRYRAFGVVTKCQTWDPEYSRFFLQTARIRKYKARAAVKPHKIQIPKRLNETNV